MASSGLALYLHAHGAYSYTQVHKDTHKINKYSYKKTSYSV